VFINKESAMFKQIVTIFRGRAADAGEAVIDANAMTILNQQIRDCVAAIESTKRTLALAIAQERQEEARLDRIAGRIKGLEARAAEALDGGSEDLAMEAAETIASMENEHADASEALARHKRETERLRAVVRQAQGRLTELERGRRTANKNAAVLKLRDVQCGSDTGFHSTLREAEATLSRLNARQGDLDAAARALDELEADNSPDTVEDKLAKAGFGPPTSTQAKDVLERLKASRASAGGGNSPKAK
jgi:phage shock protein A